MQIDRHVELFGARQDRLEARIVEKAAFGQSVDQRAAEAEIAHRAFELVGGGLRTSHRQVREAGEPIGMGGDRLGEHVVDVARKRDAFLAVEQVGAGTGRREHMNGDPGLIHLGQAKCAEIGQFVREIVGEARRKAMAGDGVGIDPAHQRRNGEMLLKGDDAHGEVSFCVRIINGFRAARAEFTE